MTEYDLDLSDPPSVDVEGLEALVEAESNRVTV